MDLLRDECCRRTLARQAIRLLVICLAFVSLCAFVPANPAQDVVLAAEPSMVDDPTAFLPPDTSYARVTYNAPVYASLDAVRAGRAFTWHGGGASVWVNVHGSSTLGDQTYYLVTWDWGTRGWMNGNALSFTPALSRLRGVDLVGRTDEHLAMVYVDGLHVRAEPGTVDEESSLGQVPRYSVVSVHEQQVVNGAVWYRIGDDQWIHSSFVRNLTPGARPERVGSDEKWIEVNLTEQVVVAHEGDTAVFASLVSTGRPGLSTVTGLFRPWLKLQTGPMRGARFGLGYDLARVPYIYYFYGAYAWHGAYWHDRYGTVQSAGCVNLSPHDANWFANWTLPTLEPGETTQRPTAGAPGTWVYIHY